MTREELAAENERLRRQYLSIWQLRKHLQAEEQRIGALIADVERAQWKLDAVD